MLKLMIADDERVIRETISTLIDWESLGIELIGVCRDGIEAYNLILDESPDIVMTDIRMPGLSGLELVQAVTRTDRQIQFIILSGYGEFEYAREAMQYGVKHYLLKPCSEEKMIQALKLASEDCQRAKRQEEERLRQNEMVRVIRQDAIYHLIMDGLTPGENDHDSLKNRQENQIEIYARYQDLGRGPCCLYYVYFLEWERLGSFLEKLEGYEKAEKIPSIFYGIYVKNTLLLFSYGELSEDLLESCCDKTASVNVEIAGETYASLSPLLERVLEKVRRYDVIYVIHSYKPFAVLNSQNIVRYMQDICGRLISGDDHEAGKCLEELLFMAKETSQYEALQMLGNSICTQLSARGFCSTAEAFQFLTELNREKDIEKLREVTVRMIEHAKEGLRQNGQDYGALAEQVMEYVRFHLSESNLTLKKIADEYLYMNVDYVSRQFHKATGKKFSQYLTEQRVKRGKELLVQEGGSKIQYVAEKVGCGNNPQYFSQIFKKMEGMPPGKWAAQMKAKQ